ncbi:MAG: hypothetical protein HY653_08470 [Acidobacteria bacterium]|nr:hypothetical protein [Acidobacteriota bacterium]
MVWASLRLVAGIFLTVLGLLGLLLPILPGWIFLIPGLIILSAHFHWARRLLDYLRTRKPTGNVR